MPQTQLDTCNCVAVFAVPMLTSQLFPTLVRAKKTSLLLRFNFSLIVNPGLGLVSHMFK